MSFGYPTQYANGLNNNSQIRRSTDMIYQRGASYNVTLTGDTYIKSMELAVFLQSDGDTIGSMSLVPSNVTQSGATYTYTFTIRPYQYFSNYIQSQHYGNYWINDWFSTNELININNPYPNIINANIKYGYKYITGTTLVTEYTGTTPTNDFDHYTMIPECATATGFTASGFTNTGGDFTYVGGVFQMEDRYYLQNFDQELGSVIGTGITINTLDIFRRLSPMSQFMIDSPVVPEESVTSRFLTEAPRIQTIQTNENLVLYFLNGQTGDRQVMECDFAVFEFYDENNVQIDYFDQQVNWSGTTYQSPTGNTTNLSIWALPCGPMDIKNIFATINWDDVSYYRVQLFYGYPTQSTDRIPSGPIGPSSEAFYFYIDTNCLPENTRITWLNNRGGYDYYTFTSFREDTKKITRATYDNRYYSTNLQSPDRDYGRTLKNFDTFVEKEFVLETDFLNETYAAWIEEMFTSPQVYEMKDDFISPLDRQDKVFKDLRPIQIISTEVQKANFKHKKLIKYRITFKYATSTFTNS